MSISAMRKGNRLSLRLAGLLGVLALIFAMSLAALPANAAAGLTLASTNLRLSQVPVVSGTGFTANERIDLWLTAPDQTVRVYGYTFADPTGNFSAFSYTPQAVAGETQAELNAMSTNIAGMWYVTAHGNTSGVNSITSFSVVGATLAAHISNVYGDLVTLTYSGGNFFANENVALWLTDSLGNVTSLGSAWATPDGNIPSLTDDTGTLINTIRFINDGTSAPYQITAHGNTSGQTVIAAVAAS